VAARFHTEDPRGDVVVLATGFTYKLNKNLQLDAGVNVGVTSAADRINPFVGLSRRF
jgi:long-subunit fatty acid transport protein